MRRDACAAGGSDPGRLHPGRAWVEGDGWPDETWVGHTWTTTGSYPITVTTTWDARFTINGTYLPETQAALVALGASIGAARREVGWSAIELAERIGSSPALVGRIERGVPGTAIGTVFEAAVVCGVPLFDVPADGLPAVAARAKDRLALLPQRIHARPAEVSDDF